MAIVLTDCSVNIGGNDLSEHFTSVNLEATAETQDSTPFQVTGGWREMEPGLKVSAGSFDFNQDFDAGGFDALVFPMFGTKQPLVLTGEEPSRRRGQPTVDRGHYPYQLPHPWQQRRRLGRGQPWVSGERCLGKGSELMCPCKCGCKNQSAFGLICWPCWWINHDEL